MQITINGKTYPCSKDQFILEVCKENGIDIPTLCHDDRLKPYGGCRMCVVEIEGKKSPEVSCATKVRDGMVVHTHTPKLFQMRRSILDLLFSNHPNECLQCNKSGECKLQDYCYEYGVGDGSFREGEIRHIDSDMTNKFFNYDSRKCIDCGVCVRTCAEITGANALTFRERGFDTTIGAAFDIGIGNSTCVSCGNCVSNCPTGALQPKRRQTDLPYRYWETKRVATTCSYCGVGCHFELLVKDNQVVEVQPINGTPNDGALCVKGKFAFRFINHKDRLTSPLIKREGQFVEASWEEAYSLIKQKAKETMAAKGPSGFAGFTSARCTNEENYLFQKLFRTVFKTNSVDHCARL